MFKRNKTDKGKTQANRLSDEAEPNVLAWDAAETEDAEDAEDPELEEDGDFEEDESEDEDPEVVARRQAELAAELQRQAEEYGLTSADPKAIYGPNGEAVASVLDALAELDMETAERLADAWDAVAPAERDVLERVMQRQHRGGEHEYELSAAEDSVAQWLAAQKPKGDEAVEVVRIVALAARDAVDAFVLDEILDDVDYDTLAGPWLEVMDADEADGEAEADTAAGDTDTDGAKTPVDGDGGQFGPNTALLVDLLERLRALTFDDLARIEQVWKTADKHDLKDAHKAVESAVKEDKDWREQVRLAQDEIVSWAALEGRKAFIPPLVDCVAALVLADILEPEDAELLYAPWADVVGEPALPTYEDNDADEDDDDE